MHVVAADVKFYWRFSKIFEKICLILKENTLCVGTDNIYILSKSRSFDKKYVRKKNQRYYFKVLKFLPVLYIRDMVQKYFLDAKNYEHAA